jgi:MFS family permease
MDKNRLFLWSIVAALAGFIFGFDTVVISGANLPIKELWHTSSWFHGFFIMSMALWGTLAGALFGGIPIQTYGRKKVLLWIGILYTISAFGTALAPDPYTFSFFRFIGGVGIGVSSVVAPTYISEISTPAMRGRLVAMYQFNIVFGILIAFISNYLLEGLGGENDWRWMLGVLAIPSVIYTLLVPGLPESPRWLISRKNDIEGAKAILQRIGVSDTDAEIRTNRFRLLRAVTISWIAVIHASCGWLFWSLSSTSCRASTSFSITHPRSCKKPNWPRKSRCSIPYILAVPTLFSLL